MCSLSTVWLQKDPAECSASERQAALVEAAQLSFWLDSREHAFRQVLDEEPSEVHASADALAAVRSIRDTLRGPRHAAGRRKAPPFVRAAERAGA